MTDMPSPLENESKIRVALVSVGGSPSPVLHILEQHRPSHVWYFCSAVSRSVAEEIHRKLDWNPFADFIEVARFEELGPCYAHLRKTIPDLLDRWKISVDEVLVDYTGGTKTMSVALTLAATEVFSRFSYVGGEQREKAGLGITLDGREKVVYQGNPWRELAVREIEQCRFLWDCGHFDAVATILREIAPKVPRRFRFEALADMSQALADRHRLDFKKAQIALGLLGNRLPQIYDGHPAGAGLIDFVIESRNICAACASPTSSEDLLREILDNSLRTAAQHRYEDAAARLYRAIEMRGQLWLSERTDGVFKNGLLKDPALLPEALNRPPFVVGGEAEVKLSLELCFRALHALGDERAAAVCEDIDLERKSRFRAATQSRNMSILAHGVLPIGKDGFEKLKGIATEFFAFDLERPFQTWPALDLAWFTDPTPTP